MFDEEEVKLKKWKEEIEKTDVPKDELEWAIKQGFQRAKNASKVKKRPYIKRGVWSAIVAAILLITLVTTIRVMPAFANVVAAIPGMEKIVALIQDNKGLQAAIDNEYYQLLNHSIEKDGVTLTLDGAIADEQEMIIFYTLKGVKEGEEFEVRLPDLMDNNGVDVVKRSSSDSGSEWDKNSLERTGRMNFHYKEGINDNEFILKGAIESASRSIDYEIPFSLAKEKMPTTRYPINKTVSIEGQKITIKQIEVSPIKVGIHVRVDPSNTKQIFGFEDLRLVDDKGEIWSSITDGLVASGTGENQTVYYLQSNYFEQPQGLTLKFNKLQAMDKNEAYVVLDTDKGIILEQPRDQRFTVKKTTHTLIELYLNGEKEFHHDPFISFSDAEGKEIRSMGGGFSRDSDERIELSVRLPDEPYVNPIKLPLVGYPQWIEGEVKIKIK